MARIIPHVLLVPSHSRPQVGSALSDPNHARWFSGATNGKTLFIGDYDGLAVDSTGRAHPNWTDLRYKVDPALQLLPNQIKGENIYNASMP